MPLLFTIEGNIGVGKTTLINTLRNTPTINGHTVVFLEEPVSIWESIKDETGKNIIELFYANQETYAFSFQMMAYISRLTALKDAMEQHPDAIIITERSVYTDKYIFAQMLFDDKKISSIEYHIYNKWFDYFLKEVPLSGIIYLKCDPKVANERVRHRARAGETIPLEYLERCHQYHQQWIENTSIPTNTVDCNNSLPNLNEISAFISTIIG
jgi:deoxyadenosine/deoxycytidine kinase